MNRTNQQGRFARAGYYRSRWRAVAQMGVAASSMAKFGNIGNPTRAREAGNYDNSHPYTRAHEKREGPTEAGPKWETKNMHD